jgi:hypothetical protein
MDSLFGDFFGDSSGGGGVPTRSDFAKGVIDHFAKQVSIQDDETLDMLVDFVTARILAPEEVWIKSDSQEMTEGLPKARKALEDALYKLNQIAPLERIERTDIPTVAEGVFLAVIKYQHNCPYPLIFC